MTLSLCLLPFWRRKERELHISHGRLSRCVWGVPRLCVRVSFPHVDHSAVRDMDGYGEVDRSWGDDDVPLPSILDRPGMGSGRGAFSYRQRHNTTEYGLQTSSGFQYRRTLLVTLVGSNVYLLPSRDRRLISPLHDCETRDALA